jgi:hypothetical protein
VAERSEDERRRAVAGGAHTTVTVAGAVRFGSDSGAGSDTAAEPPFL